MDNNNNLEIWSVECKDCNVHYSYEDFQQHSKNDCINNIKKKYEGKMIKIFL